MMIMIRRPLSLFLALFIALFGMNHAFRIVSRNTVSRASSRCFAMSTNPISYKIGFMFPGQGAQSVGMAKAVTDELPAAKLLFDKASSILGYDLLDKCVNGPKEQLDSTVISQPAIFVSSMAALEKLKLENLELYNSATVAMGLSLGEYSALCFAGAFSFEDGVRLTKLRGEAMQAASDASSSGMVAILGCDVAKVDEICKAAAEKSGKPISIANYLCAGNYAVSGAKEACEVAREIAPQYGATMIVPLAVAGAFHTQFMASAVDPLRKALAQVEIKTPRLPVISNVDAEAHYDPNDIRDILARQVTNPVQWETIIGRMVKSPEYVKSYEIGPGKVCRGLIKRFGKKLEVDSVTV